MIILENEQYLLRKFPGILENLKDNINGNNNLTAFVSKTGLPTLQIEFNGQQVFLHSKYDPMNEAQQWIRPFEEQMEQYNHVFFYGIGFGYHIEFLMNKYPDKVFTLYEPNPEIFYEYLCKRELSKLPLSSLKSLLLEYGAIDTILDNMLQNVTDEFIMIPHPVYERIFETETKQFFEIFKQRLHSRVQNMDFSSSTKNLIIENYMNNFMKVLQTPNILRDKKNFFKGKPVLIVAAGPSLEEEIENIRIIKEHGLAYLFAVGSANKALLSANIYPDAICSYDPFDVNLQVFDIIIKENISEIPLVFGSSIAHSVVADYPGPMLHFISDRDHISKYYLAHERLVENNELISNAPFISIITLDLLQKLGCELIIFVGQNFALKDEQLYSKGIEYQDRTDEFAELVESRSEYVESVEGKQIKSLKSFSLGRVDLEKKIAQLRGITIINTTKGGAKIRGTQFMELEQVISQKLDHSVVIEDWYKSDSNDYNKSNILIQINLIGQDFKLLPSLFLEIIKWSRKLEKLSVGNNSNKIKFTNDKILNLMKALLNNSFNKAFIESDLVYQAEALNAAIVQYTTSTLTGKEIRTLVEAYILYIAYCRELYEERHTIFIQFQEYLIKQLG